MPGGPTDVRNRVPDCLSDVRNTDETVAWTGYQARDGIEAYRVAGGDHEGSKDSMKAIIEGMKAGRKARRQGG